MSRNVQSTVIYPEDSNAVVSVFVKGSKPVVAIDTHPNWDAILEGIAADDENVIALFDIGETVSKKFEGLTERVSYANGVLYFDGDPIHNTLTDQVVRFLDEGVNDWVPLVLFLEKVQQNPNEHSREQLYTWLAQKDFTITHEGDIVGYKGCKNGPDGVLVSIHQGKAVVDGEVKQGAIPYPIGSVVEMPRSEVTHDPAEGCSYGLHVGTYDYAVTYAGQGALLEVHVNPRDVVSVPTDSNWAKMRVCRLTVVQTLDAPYTSAVVWGEFSEDEDDEGEDDYSWGELEYDDYADGEADDDECDDPYCIICNPLTDDEDDVELDENVFVNANAGYQRIVNPGDTFVDRDSRRGGRTVTVEKLVGNGFANCRSSTSGNLVTISVDRLLSRKYARV